MSRAFDNAPASRDARARARAVAAKADAETDPDTDDAVLDAALRDPDALPMTEEQLARMRPAEEVIPEVLAARGALKGGRPKSQSPKKLVSLRLKPEVLAAYRALGPGWQTLMSDEVERGIARAARKAAGELERARKPRKQKRAARDP